MMRRENGLADIASYRDRASRARSRSRSAPVLLLVLVALVVLCPSFALGEGPAVPLVPDCSDGSVGQLLPREQLMKLEKAGFFRELRHGQPNGPSLVESRGGLQPEIRPRVVAYLRGGSVLAATGSMVGDWFDPSDVTFAPLEIRTDGAWVWPGDLPYYVEKYGVGVPTNLLVHMASRAWSAPELSKEDLLLAERRFVEPEGEA